MAALDQPHLLEHAQRIAHGAAAGAEEIGQLALGRQPVPRLDAPLRDQGFDLRDDLVVDLGLVDLLNYQLNAP
jgi:hypothetical protein